MALWQRCTAALRCSEVTSLGTLPVMHLMNGGPRLIPRVLRFILLPVRHRIHAARRPAGAARGQAQAGARGALGALRSTGRLNRRVRSERAAAGALQACVAGAGVGRTSAGGFWSTRSLWRGLQAHAGHAGPREARTGQLPAPPAVARHRCTCCGGPPSAPPVSHAPFGHAHRPSRAPVIMRKLTHLLRLAPAAAPAPHAAQCPALPLPLPPAAHIRQAPPRTGPRLARRLTAGAGVSASWSRRPPPPP